MVIKLATHPWVLVRVPIVLLSPKRTSLDIGQARDVASTGCLESHLDEFGVLFDHGLNDTEETE